MLASLSMAVLLAPCFAAASIILMLKAAWHWHCASEMLTPLDLAGLSDGRDVADDLTQDALAQMASNGKGALSAATSAILGSIAAIAGYFS